MKYTYYQLGIMAAVVSFLGFVVENIWLAMTKGYINNRNMNAPFLLGYGLLILFMYAVFGTPAALRMFAKERCVGNGIWFTFYVHLPLSV